MKFPEVEVVPKDSFTYKYSDLPVFKPAIVCVVEEVLNAGELTWISVGSPDYIVQQPVHLRRGINIDRVQYSSMGY